MKKRVFLNQTLIKCRYLCNYNKEYQLELKNLYSNILDSFNDINNTKLEGIIFGFSKIDTNTNEVEFINNIEEFKNFLNDKQNVIGTYLNSLYPKDNFVIIELEYDEKFNPIYIDYNDFQFLMPPIYMIYPFNKKSIDRIYSSIKSGELTKLDFPSNIIQSHLPYIKK